MSTLHPHVAAVVTERDNNGDDPRQRAVLVTGGQNLTTVTDIVAGIAERKPNLYWLIAFGTAATVCTVFFSLLGYLVLTGIGIWGNNQPVSWAFDIINFVFWIGIG